MTNFRDLIVEYPNVISKDLCYEIISRFEDDTNKSSGQTADRSPSRAKISTDLHLSSYQQWSDIDDKIFELFGPYCKKYLEFLSNTFGGAVKPSKTQIMDSGYQIQRTMKGEYYRWHTDDQYCAIWDTITQPFVEEKGEVIDDTRSCGYERRLFTYIFYLNDNFFGGKTQFQVGSSEEDTISITPEQGKLLCFPANFLYPHQGAEVTAGVKYIMTGWVNDYIKYPIMDGSPMSMIWRQEYVEQGRQMLVPDPVQQVDQ